MKKILLFAALLGFAVACGGNEKKEEAKTEEAQVEATVVEEAGAAEEADNIAVSAPEVTVDKPAITTDAPIIKGAGEINKDNGLSIADEKVAIKTVQVAEKETTKAADAPTVISGTNEVKKESNLKVGGTVGAGTIQAM